MEIRRVKECQVPKRLKSSGLLPFPIKKYKIILADPPWRYKDKRVSHKRICGGAAGHYKTMKVDDIKNLPVKDIADDDSILFIWVTFPFLKEGLEVIRSWGFIYKTLGFSWIKKNKKNGKPFFGIGNYTKSNCEVCLIGVKGHPVVKNNDVSSVIFSKIRDHSRKPDEVRKRIVRLMGDLPRIELFSRDKIKGWDSWGDEIPGLMQNLLI